MFVTLTSNAEKQGLQEPIQRARSQSSSRSASTASYRSSQTRHGCGIPTSHGVSDLPLSTTARNHRGTWTGLWAVLIKEFVHIRRQPTTLFFMLVVPVMQTIIFGYAIDTQIENIPTVVFNMDGRQQSRELVAAFENTRRFRLIGHVWSEEEFQRALSSGRAKVGIRIPPNYVDQVLRGEQAKLQILIDGSDSQVATTAQSTAQLLGMNLSIQMAMAKGRRTAIGSGSRRIRSWHAADRCANSHALQPRPGKLAFLCPRLGRNHLATGHAVPHVVRRRSRTRTGDAGTIVRDAGRPHRTVAGETTAVCAWLASWRC